MCIALPLKHKVFMNTFGKTRLYGGKDAAAETNRIPTEYIVLIY